jgi:geranylgeranyl reductase family protein
MIALSSSERSIIVVGGGPAGATAARFLALHGVPVQVLDKARFPRNKPCGGGISARALKRFPYLNGRLNGIATRYISRLHLEGPDGQAAVITADQPAALMVRRLEFDALLLELAREAGAEVVPDADVVQAAEQGKSISLMTRNGRTFSAPVVIAADGVHSVIARRLGINPGWPASSVALDMMEETPRDELRDLDPSTLWVAYGCHLDGHRPVQGTRAGEGYAYIFPKRDHVNIGVGYMLSHYRTAIDRAPYDVQREFVRQLRERGIVEGESNRHNFTPFLIPMGGPLRRPGRGRVLLAGDAGGFVNAFTAEGIYYAMVSGELAARAVTGVAVDRGDLDGLAERYRQACDHEIGTELRDSVLIQQYLFADRRRIARVIAGAAGDRATTRLIIDAVMGRRGYGTVRRQLLVRSPGLAARFLWARIRKTAVGLQSSLRC